MNKKFRSFRKVTAWVMVVAFLFQSISWADNLSSYKLINLSSKQDKLAPSPHLAEVMNALERAIGGEASNMRTVGDARRFLDGFREDDAKYQIAVALLTKWFKSKGKMTKEVSDFLRSIALKREKGDSEGENIMREFLRGHEEGMRGGATEDRRNTVVISHEEVGFILPLNPVINPTARRYGDAAPAVVEAGSLVAQEESLSEESSKPICIDFSKNRVVVNGVEYSDYLKLQKGDMRSATTVFVYINHYLLPVMLNERTELSAQEEARFVAEFLKSFFGISLRYFPGTGVYVFQLLSRIEEGVQKGVDSYLQVFSHSRLSGEVKDPLVRSIMSAWIVYSSRFAEHANIDSAVKSLEALKAPANTGEENPTVSAWEKVSSIISPWKPGLVPWEVTIFGKSVTVHAQDDDSYYAVVPAQYVEIAQKENSRWQQYAWCYYEASDKDDPRIITRKDCVTYSHLQQLRSRSIGLKYRVAKDIELRFYSYAEMAEYDRKAADGVINDIFERIDICKRQGVEVPARICDFLENFLNVQTDYHLEKVGDCFSRRESWSARTLDEFKSAVKDASLRDHIRRLLRVMNDGVLNERCKERMSPLIDSLGDFENYSEEALPVDQREEKPSDSVGVAGLKKKLANSARIISAEAEKERLAELERVKRKRSPQVVKDYFCVLYGEQVGFSDPLVNAYIQCLLADEVNLSEPSDEDLNKVFSEMDKERISDDGETVKNYYEGTCERDIEEGKKLKAKICLLYYLQKRSERGNLISLANLWKTPQQILQQFAPACFDDTALLVICDLAVNSGFVWQQISKASAMDIGEILRRPDLSEYIEIQRGIEEKQPSVRGQLDLKLKLLKMYSANNGRDIKEEDLLLTPAEIVLRRIMGTNYREIINNFFRKVRQYHYDNSYIGLVAPPEFYPYNLMYFLSALPKHDDNRTRGFRQLSSHFGDGRIIAKYAPNDRDGFLRNVPISILESLVEETQYIYPIIERIKEGELGPEYAYHEQIGDKSPRGMGRGGYLVAFGTEMNTYLMEKYLDSPEGREKLRKLRELQDVLTRGFVASPASTTAPTTARSEGGMGLIRVIEGELAPEIGSGERAAALAGIKNIFTSQQIATEGGAVLNADNISVSTTATDGETFKDYETVSVDSNGNVAVNGTFADNIARIQKAGKNIAINFTSTNEDGATAEAVRTTLTDSIIWGIAKHEAGIGGHLAMEDGRVVMQHEDLEWKSNMGRGRKYQTLNIASHLWYLICYSQYYGRGQSMPEGFNMATALDNRINAGWAYRWLNNADNEDIKTEILSIMKQIDEAYNGTESETNIAVAATYAKQPMTKKEAVRLAKEVIRRVSIDKIQTLNEMELLTELTNMLATVKAQREIERTYDESDINLITSELVREVIVLRETARPKAETSSELKAKSCAMNVLSDAIEMFKEAETNAMVSQEINFRKAFGNGTNPTQYFLVDVDAMTVGDDEMKRLKTALSSAGSQTSIIIVWSSQSSKSEGELSAKINALSLGEIGASVTQHKVCNNPNGSLAGMAYAAHVAETLGTDINRYLLITSADNFMSTYCWLTVGMRLVNRIFTKGATRIKLSKEEVDALKNVGKLDGKFIEENKDGSMYLIVNPYDTESASKDLAALKGARDKIAKAA